MPAVHEWGAVEPVLAHQLIHQSAERRMQTHAIGRLEQSEPRLLRKRVVAVLLEAHRELIMAGVDDHGIGPLRDRDELLVLLLERVTQERQNVELEPARGNGPLEPPGHDLPHREPGPEGLSHGTGPAQHDDPILTRIRVGKRGRHDRKAMHPVSPGRRADLQRGQREQAREAEQEDSNNRGGAPSPPRRPDQEPCRDGNSDEPGQQQRTIHEQDAPQETLRRPPNDSPGQQGNPARQHHQRRDQQGECPRDHRDPPPSTSPLRASCRCRVLGPSCRPAHVQASTPCDLVLFMNRPRPGRLPRSRTRIREAAGSGIRREDERGTRPSGRATAAAPSSILRPHRRSSTR